MWRDHTTEVWACSVIVLGGYSSWRAALLEVEAGAASTLELLCPLGPNDHLHPADGRGKTAGSSYTSLLKSLGSEGHSLFLLPLHGLAINHHPVCKRGWKIWSSYFTQEMKKGRTDLGDQLAAPASLSLPPVVGICNFTCLSCLPLFLALERFCLWENSFHQME